VLLWAAALGSVPVDEARRAVSDGTPNEVNVFGLFGMLSAAGAGGYPHGCRRRRRRLLDDVLCLGLETVLPAESERGVRRRSTPGWSPAQACWLGWLISS
jgi:hypothetical protein